MSATQFAAALRSQPSLNYNGEAVFLVVCNAGVSQSGLPSFAQQLANALNVPVMGANNYVWVSSQGDVFVYPQKTDANGNIVTNSKGSPVPDKTQPGSFVKFSPGG